MYSPAGWWVSRAPLSACLLSRPEAKVGRWTRCFRTFCWKPRHAGSTSTMRPSFGSMSPEGRNNVVQEFWRGQYSSQMIRTQLTQRIVAVFKQGLHTLTCSFARGRKQVALKKPYRYLKTLAFSMKINVPFMSVKEKEHDTAVKEDGIINGVKLHCRLNRLCHFCY